MEPFSSLVNEALLKLSEDVSTSNDAFTQQADDEFEEELQNTANDLLNDYSDIYQSQDNLRDVLDIVHDMEKRSVKNLSWISSCVIGWPHIFVSGNPGCG